jgi:hypothetical protein
MGPTASLIHIDSQQPLIYRRYSPVNSIMAKSSSPEVNSDLGGIKQVHFNG